MGSSFFCAKILGFKLMNLESCNFAPNKNKQ